MFSVICEKEKKKKTKKKKKKKEKEKGRKTGKKKRSTCCAGIPPQLVLHVLYGSRVCRSRVPMYACLAHTELEFHPS